MPRQQLNVTVLIINWHILILTTESILKYVIIISSAARKTGENRNNTSESFRNAKIIPLHFGRKRSFRSVLFGHLVLSRRTWAMPVTEMGTPWRV